MRILTLDSGEILRPGGANKFIVILNRELVRFGHSCTVIIEGDANLPREEMHEGFRIIRVESRFSNLLYGMNPEMCRYIKKHYQELNPDIIFVHGYHTLASPLAVWFLRLFLNKNARIVFTPHFDPLTHASCLGKVLGRAYDWAIGRRLMKQVDVVVADSDYEAANLSKILDVCGNLKIVPLGVDVITPSPARDPNGRIKMLYVGYLLEYKGVEDIIRALHELIIVRSIGKVEFTVVGEGPSKQYLMNEAETLKVSGSINWKPFLPQDELLRELNGADVLVHLSKSEAYGLIVAEALGLGIPAIVTRGTALEEFAKEPGCYCVDCPPDSSEVADLVLWICEHRPKVGPFSRKIRLWTAVVRDYEQIFKDLFEKT